MSTFKVKEFINNTGKKITKSNFITMCFTNPLWYSFIITIIILIIGYLIFKNIIDIQGGDIFKYGFYILQG